MNRKWEILPQSQNKVDIRNQRTFLSKKNVLLLKLERLAKSRI